MTTNNASGKTDLQPIAKSKNGAGSRQSRWQLLVISQASANSPVSVRRDLAHSPNSPHLQLGWSQQVGWHNVQAGSVPVAVPAENNSGLAISSHKIAAPKFLSAGKPYQQSQFSTESVIEIEDRLLELAQQLAEDIQGPLAASQQIISRISNQARGNSYLSLDDAQQLSSAARNLDLIAQWTESVLLSRKIEQGGLQVIRSRFAPTHWRDSIVGVLETIAKPKNITIEWVGWSGELPLLYLDARHLTRAVLNLVANAVATSEPNGVVTIRASWQHNVTGRLMVTIEDNGIALPPALMKMLNSSATDGPSPTEGSGLQIARQLIGGIGGLIAAQHGPSKGNIVRISLPVDSYSSVIRSWMLQNATTAASSVRYRVALFAVRCNRTESNLFNDHLQKSATARQFVYRVAENRWLVLELKSYNERSDSTLMAAAEQLVPPRLQESQPWLSQSVFVSQPFALDGLLGRTDGDLRLPQLTEQLVEKFEELLSHQQPVLDRLTISESVIPAPHFNRPLAAPLVADKKIASPAVAAQVEPGAETVNEIVKQWKVVQAKLAALASHPAMNR